MVKFPAADLDIQVVIRSKCFQEPVGPPFYRALKILQLPAGLIAFPELNAAPGEQGEGARKREGKFDSIARIVISARQIQALLRAIAKSGGASPRNTEVRRKGARALGIIEIKRFLEGFGVVEVF